MINVRKATTWGIGILFIALLTGVDSCHERLELQVVGKVVADNGQVVHEGAGQFCYQRFREVHDEGAVLQGIKRCVPVQFSLLSDGYEQMSFQTTIRDSVAEVPLRLAYELRIEEQEFAGSLVRQQGIHRESDGVHRGRAVLEFYPQY